jgi:Ca-activated chloride channel family protein
MSFVWPSLLWLLLLIPLLVAAYFYLLRRKKRQAVRYANLLIVKQAMAGRASFRRHVPPLLTLGALTLMIIAVARPQAVVTVADYRGTVILAMDVSGSMRADDIAPTRIEAAQAAARGYIESLPPNVRAGIVVFAGSAFLVQQPTTDREDLLSAIERFELQRGTNLGSAIVVSLETIFDVDLDLDDEGPFAQGPGFGAAPFDAGPLGAAPLGELAVQPEAATPPPGTMPGSFDEAMVILLTDGRATAGPDPIEAARLASVWGVRVFTVGFGTADGGVVEFAGQRRRQQLDEETLRQVAEITRGDYFLAGTGDELENVLDTLNTQLVTEREETEITALFAGLAGLLTLLAAGLSLAWFGRVL